MRVDELTARPSQLVAPPRVAQQRDDALRDVGGVVRAAAGERAVGAGDEPRGAADAVGRDDAFVAESPLELRTRAAGAARDRAGVARAGVEATGRGER